MPAQQQDKPDTEREKPVRPQLDALIGKHVMTTLGQPDQLLKVQVRKLWDDRYRVNVIVGADAASVKVAHSYFLITDADGNIVASTPKIIRHY